MRVLALLWLRGIWEAAASLGGSSVATALFTSGAVGLAAWALAVLRKQ